MNRILAISDIHGELALFEELLLKANYNPDEDQLFYSVITLTEVQLQVAC